MKSSTTVFIIKFELGLFAVMFAWSFLMYSFTDGDKAFTRMFASLICAGLYAIIEKLEDINSKQK
jgi:hypothetical protein